MIGNVLVGTALTKPDTVATVPYTEFLAQLDADNVGAVSAEGDTIQGTLREPRAYPADEGKSYTKSRANGPPSPRTTSSASSAPTEWRSRPGPCPRAHRWSRRS